MPYKYKLLVLSIVTWSYSCLLRTIISYITDNIAGCIFQMYFLTFET